MFRIILTFGLIFISVHGQNPKEIESFFGNCLGDSILAQGNQKSKIGYHQCTTIDKGVVIKSLNSIDNLTKLYCVYYQKRDGSQSEDSDILDFQTYNDFRLNYTGAVVNRRSVGASFILKRDDRYRGRFAFEGKNGEFGLLNIKVNGQEQVCMENNRQVFPDLGFLQNYFDKQREDAPSHTKPTHEKLSFDERRIVCGYSKKTNPREIDDNIVVPGEFPWFVSISKTSGRYSDQSDFSYGVEYKCAGTLIDENHILTTASCLHENDYCLAKEQLKIQISPFYLSALISQGRPNNPDILKVKKIHIHDNFTASTRANNIAVIQLENLVSYNDYISQACLPMSLYNVITGQKGTVLGYGKFESREMRVETIGEKYQGSSTRATPIKKNPTTPAPSNKLVDSYEIDKKLIRNLPREVEFEVAHAERDNTGFFFAEKRNADKIYPDEGSGMYVKSGKQWKITGILSHKEGKDKDNKEIFKFVNIEKLRDWIDNILAEQN